MEASERDDTQDWLLSEETKPPLFNELVERVDEALDVAYASEAAIESIGRAATEAAGRARDAQRQAKVAAEHAERSAGLAARAGAAAASEKPPTTRSASPRPVEDPSLLRFSDRADKLVARLRALQRIPLRSHEAPRSPSA